MNSLYIPISQYNPCGVILFSHIPCHIPTHASILHLTFTCFPQFDCSSLISLLLICHKISFPLTFAQITDILLQYVCTWYVPSSPAHCKILCVRWQCASSHFLYSHLFGWITNTTPPILLPILPQLIPALSLSPAIWPIMSSHFPQSVQYGICSITFAYDHSGLLFSAGHKYGMPSLSANQVNFVACILFLGGTLQSFKHKLANLHTYAKVLGICLEERVLFWLGCFPCKGPQCQIHSAIPTARPLHLYSLLDLFAAEYPPMTSLAY